jgi:diguanylate cyclase (GGDEF)-like protein
VPLFSSDTSRVPPVASGVPVTSGIMPVTVARRLPPTRANGRYAAPPTWLVRRMAALAGAAFAVFVFTVLAPPAGVGRLVAAAGTFGAGAAAAWLSVQAARRTTTSQRWLWRLQAATLTGWVAARLLAPVPLHQLVGVGACAALTAITVSLVGTPADPADQVRRVLDTGLVAAGLLAAAPIVSPGVARLHGAWLLPAVTAAVVAAVTLVCATRPGVRWRQTTVLIGAGSAVAASADLVGSGRVADLLWVAGVVGVGLAAWLFRDRRARQAPGPERPGAAAVAVLHLPLVAGAVAAAWLHLHHADLSPVTTLGLPAAVLATTVRNLLAAGDNRRLAATATLAGTRAEALVAQSNDVVLLTYADGTITWASPAAAGMLGVLPQALCGVDVRSLLIDGSGKVDSSGKVDDAGETDGYPAAFRSAVDTGVGTTTRWLGRITPVRTGYQWVEVSMRNHLTNPAIGSLVITISDVTVRQESEMAVRHQATHDDLTGLANRPALLTDLQNRLDRGAKTAVLFCDLDKFKSVNDTFGHDVGDEVLVAVADRLSSTCRPEDVVSRLGGDEFVVACEVTDLAAARAVADRLAAALAPPIPTNRGNLVVTASVGVRMVECGKAADALKGADTAMYVAKNAGRGRAALFDEGQAAA